MSVPYVIDNQKHLLADVLNGILGQHGGAVAGCGDGGRKEGAGAMRGCNGG